MRMREIRECFKKIKYLSSSINGSNCLSALALMHINLDFDIDAKHVLKIFSKRDRALEFINISFDLFHSVFSKQYPSILITMFFRFSWLQSWVGSVLLKKKQNSNNNKKTRNC